MRLIMPFAFIGCLLLFVLSGCASTASPEVDTGRNEKAAQINTQLGASYLNQGDLAQANKKLARAIKQDPKNATAHWVYALLKERMGEVDIAEKHFRKAISLDPKDSKAHNNFGTFLCNQNRFEEAEKEFLIAINDPLYLQADSAYVNAGLCMFQIPNKTKAVEYFEKALRINPDHRSALYQMAKISFQDKKYELAADYIQQFEKVGKHNSELLWIAYQTEITLGNEGKAEDYATQLKKQFPASEEARLLAEKYWYAGTEK